MDHYNRSNYRRDEKFGGYDPDRGMHNDDHYYPGQGKRMYGDSHGGYGGTYDSPRGWNNRGEHRHDDRNFFERVGDRIRDTWDDWTDNDRRRDSMSRDMRRHDDRNIWERAGDKMRQAFRSPDDDYRGRNDYPNPDYSRGFGNYSGNYGGYTGEGRSGFNTGSRDMYTEDPYRKRGRGYDNDMDHGYRHYRGHGERGGDYKYRTGQGSYEAGDFGFNDDRQDDYDRRRNRNRDEWW